MPTITFDGATKVITIGFDGPTTVVSWQDIYSRWKDWVLSGLGAQWDEAFGLSVGGNDLGDGIFLDGYFFLRNDLGWRIAPADADHTLNLDGNGYGFSPSTAVYNPRPGRTITIRERQSSRSQVIQADASLLEASSAFNGFVWFDPSSPSSGTVFPVGTSVGPVNNWTDAMEISRTYGLQGVRVLGPVTLTEDVTGYEIVGISEHTAVINLGGFDVTGTIFREAIVTGAAASDVGDYTLRGCHAVNLSNFQGLMVDSGIEGTLGISGDVMIAECWSGEPGNGSPVVDFGGAARNAQVRRWAGSISVANMTGGTSTFDLVPGRLILQATATGGAVKLRGFGEPLEDSSTGVTLDTDGYNVAGDLTPVLDRLNADEELLADGTWRALEAGTSTVLAEKQFEQDCDAGTMSLKE
jgi:hypothetical protein